MEFCQSGNVGTCEKLFNKRLNFCLQKADKRHLESKVNKNLFDSTTDELNRMITDLLQKLCGHVSTSQVSHHSFVPGF